MNQEDLELLREGWDFEAKLAGGNDGRGALPSSLWETYSAMANTEGGKVLLGARERKDRSLELRGIADIDKVETDLWNVLQDRKKVSANVLRKEDVERIELEGTTLLLVRVPKAARSDRPVYLNGSWETGTYLRVHEGDRRVDREVARRMLADSVPNRDSGVIDEYTVDDLEIDSVRRYRELFAAGRVEHPFLQHPDEEFLVSVGAAKRDRNEGVLRPTWAGVWMLGKEASIRELHPHWHLSFKELPDDPNDPMRWVDRLYPDGVWCANLLEFYLRAIRKLHDGLKVPFQLEGGQFRIEETAVHDAVREALVNTLIHADYQGTTGVRLIKRRSGFEFVNPGLLLITSEQLWRGGISEARNPALQRLFGLLRLGEREGSGGPTMRKVWRAHHWRAPRISEDAEHGETHLQLPLESLLPDGAVQVLVDRFADRFTGQDELGRIVLVTAEVEGTITHARVCELSDAHPRDITLKLQELVRSKMLDSSGKTRGTVYAPAAGEKLPLFAADSGKAIASHSVASPPHRPRSSQHKDESPPHKDESSPHKDGNAESSRPQGEQLVRRVAGTKRASPEEVRAALLELCTGQYRTVVYLARALNREPVTMQQNYVSRMHKEGLLEALYPETPSHPNQAYRTVHVAEEGGE